LRCACIDIGSNTTRLLVAEPGQDGRLREVLAQRAFTRLGRGRAPEEDIPTVKIAAAADVVATQVALARRAGADVLCGVATAAVRQAPNRDAFLAAVAERSGLTIRVLSGEEEARYAFHGATGSLQHAPLGVVGVVDVGGGSSELVAGTLAEGVTWSASFRVGSGFLADHYLRSDPPAPAELDAVRRHVAGVFEGLDAPSPVAAYAVGGSATSLRRLIGAVLDHDSLNRGLRVLSSLPADEVARRFDLHPERSRVLPAGIILLDEAAATLGAPLRICSGGLREGVVLDELAKLQGT
jgi:exopolyphosphatase / guanosine-5'-triphosphate,3'-diphosphate pyrophosphatase